jgi:hypothetical protein
MIYGFFRLLNSSGKRLGRDNNKDDEHRCGQLPERSFRLGQSCIEAPCK